MQRYENRIATIGKEDSCNFRRSGVSLVLDGERYPLGELAPVGMIGFDFGIGLAAQRKRLICDNALIAHASERCGRGRIVAYALDNLIPDSNRVSD